MESTASQGIGNWLDIRQLPLRTPTLTELFCFLVFLGYAALFYFDVNSYWFHPEWTTDDALQQWFPLHMAHHPDVFADDFIAETMAGYLAPIHYWIAYGLTLATGGPMMAAHYMMLLQIVLVSIFSFLLVRKLSSTPAAFLALAWLYHTRPFMQRITGGLPRGWSPVVLTMVLYFMVSKQHKKVLVALFLGCLTHPPATLMAAVLYGLYLTWGVLISSDKKSFNRPFVTLLILSPIYIATVFMVISRPDEVGQMASYEEAISMPEFQRPHGRFPFLPLEPIWKEVRMFGFQPFMHRLHNPGRVIKRGMPYVIALGILLLYGIGYVRKRPVIHPVLTLFFVSIVGVYLLSRVLLFKLYVPDRHLQIPMTLFLVCFFSSGIWNAFAKDVKRVELKYTYPALLASMFLGCLVWLGTGDGLYGAANFNYSRYKKGRAFEWVRKFSERDALIAGHPTHIDAVPLFGERRTFVTTEVSHPFYPRYYEEMRRRLELSLQAHYAERLQDIVALLEPEGIDYFIFSRQRFYPEALETERFFSPLTPLVDDLTSRPYTEYAYKSIPRRVDLKVTPYLMFRDDQSVVISIPLLKAWLRESQGSA